MASANKRFSTGIGQDIKSVSLFGISQHDDVIYTYGQEIKDKRIKIKQERIKLENEQKKQEEEGREQEKADMQFHKAMYEERHQLNLKKKGREHYVSCIISLGLKMRHDLP